MDYAVERKHLAHLPYPRTIRLPRDRGRPKQPTHIDNEADLWRLEDSIVPSLESLGSYCRVLGSTSGGVSRNSAERSRS